MWQIVKELLPIREQLIEVGELMESEPTPVFIDNQSTVRIATNEGDQSRTKHIDIREKWLTEQVQKKKIVVNHVKSEEQLADILTKPLYSTKFASNRAKLLTQIVAVLAICVTFISGLQLKQTDPLLTKSLDYVYIKGDIRYKLKNVFANPCSAIFNHPKPPPHTESQVKACHQYYGHKVVSALPKCNRLQTIGPDIELEPITRDCSQPVLDSPLDPDATDRVHSTHCEMHISHSSLDSTSSLSLDDRG